MGGIVCWVDTMQIRMFNGCVLRLEALTGKPENEEEAADKVKEKLRERRIKVPELLTLFNGESRKQKQETVTLHNHEGNPQSATCRLTQREDASINQCF